MRSIKIVVRNGRVRHIPTVFAYGLLALNILVIVTLSLWLRYSYVTSMDIKKQNIDLQAQKENLTQSYNSVKAAHDELTENLKQLEVELVEIKSNFEQFKKEVLQ